MVAVLRDALTGIAAQSLRIGEAYAHERETIVAHSPASVGRYPHEALAIDKELVDVIVGKANRKVERSQLIMLRQHLLCRQSTYHQGTHQPNQSYLPLHSAKISNIFELQDSFHKKKDAPLKGAHRLFLTNSFS